MEIDVGLLVSPVSEDDAVGADMDYHPARHAIQQAFVRPETVNSEGQRIEPPEVDWRGVIRLIVEQFGQTKDIWLATYLCRAGAQAGQLEVVVAGAEALAGLLDRYWDVVHPTLDEVGLPGRKAPCDALAHQGEFLGPLERVPLISHPRLGAYSGLDLERFRQNAESEDGYGFFRNLLAETGDAPLALARDQLAAIEGALRRADAIFTDRAAGGPSPNFKLTYALLARLIQAASAFVTTDPAPASVETGGEGAMESDPSAAIGESARSSGSINSRDDIIRAIDAICDYYKRREPSSPVPMVLQRAREWVTLDFMSLLEDIAPDSLSDVRRVLSRRTEN